MPKIKNQYYSQFREGYIDLVTREQFEEWLKGIAKHKLPRKCTLEQARAIFICLFYTGARPSELVEIKGKDVKKIKDGRHYFVEITMPALKGGKNAPILIPFNKFTKELHNYISQRPPMMFAFWAFRKENKNKVSWSANKTILLKETFPDGTSKIKREPYFEKKSKTYTRKGNLLNYYVTLWTGRPAYWFRHHRFSSMYANGATDVAVQLFKRAKDPKSVNAYKHMSKKMAKDTVQTLGFVSS